MLSQRDSRKYTENMIYTFEDNDEEYDETDNRDHDIV